MNDKVTEAAIDLLDALCTIPPVNRSRAWAELRIARRNMVLALREAGHINEDSYRVAGLQGRQRARAALAKLGNGRRTPFEQALKDLNTLVSGLWDLAADTVGFEDVEHTIIAKGSAQEHLHALAKRALEGFKYARGFADRGVE